MVIRSNLSAPDISIKARNLSEFHYYMSKVLSLVSDNTSMFYIESEYLIDRLIECSLRVVPSLAEECPLIFDSWSCFNATSPGSIMMEPCPDFADLTFSSKRNAFKSCNSDGNWWAHPISNATWTNYTKCVNLEDMYIHDAINLVSLIGLSVSLVTSLLSLVIFCSFPALKCGRITMHKNLFGSLILNSSSWIAWYIFVIYDLTVLVSNTIWCRLMNIFTTYCTLTTYFWMMCEGAHLYLVLVHTFMDERQRVHILVPVGWMTPIVIVIIYSLYRLLYENSMCWMNIGWSNWILGIPVVFIMFINVIFLCRVMMIIKKKMRNTVDPSNTNVPIRNWMKQAQSAFFLIPILGIYYILLPIRPAPGASFEHVYDSVHVVSTSFQGFFVSLLLCFLNSEVQHQVKLRWRLYRVNQM